MGEVTTAWENAEESITTWIEYQDRPPTDEMGARHDARRVRRLTRKLTRSALRLRPRRVSFAPQFGPEHPSVAYRTRGSGPGLAVHPQMGRTCVGPPPRGAAAA